jgi:hypothetical protein
VNGFPACELIRPPEEHPWEVDRRLAIEEPAWAQDRGVAAHTSENLSGDPEASEDQRKWNHLMENGEGLSCALVRLWSFSNVGLHQSVS